MSNYFSKNLKYLRENKGISKNKLSELVGVNQSTIGRWETNEITPSIDNVEEVAKVLNVALPDLLIKDLEFNNYVEEENNHEKYKQILKSKGLMDENDNINEENLDKLLKIADMVEGLNQKKED